jgi:PIN domain nuclease of toxin-antitoxin system
VRLLLDTHIFVWANTTPSRLSPTARAALVSKSNNVFVSAATAWEIAIKVAVGRLSFVLDNFEAMVSEPGFEPLQMTAAHGIAAGLLPRHHGDPFDRMLIAQARTEGLTLVTVDRTFSRYDVPVLA